MENLPSFTLPLDTIAHVAFYLLVIVYVVFTIILYYHWENYSVDKRATLQTYLAYFIVTIPLIAIMGLGVLLI